MIASQTIVKKSGGSYRPTPDVTVINDDLIKQAMKRYYEENKEEYKIVNVDAMPFNELRVLNLSFQEIYKIQNLEGLSKLEELRLDNNKIKKIENISHLVNLKWLDLSFNVIEKIEGLTELIKLQDLSLYNNQIREIEGLDNCTEINVLSIGNNLIEKHEPMLDYLKKFRKLEVFNVAGNPFTKKEPEYDLICIFHLTNLKYLDYSFIDEAMKIKMEEKDDLKALKPKRQQELKEQEENDRSDKDKVEQMKKLKEAKVDTLDNIIGEILNDQDFERLKYIRGAENEVQKFITKFQENSKELKDQIVQKNAAKIEQIRKFTTELEQKTDETELETKANIENFQKRMKNTFRKFENPDYDDDKELYELRDDTETLENELLDIEMQFIEMEDNAIKDFGYKLGANMQEMTKTVNDTFEKFKADVRILNTNILKVTQEELDRYQEYTSAENAPEEKPYTDEQEFFLDNRDGVLSVAGQFIENVEGKIFKKETEITDAINKYTQDFTNALKEKQYERNRRNVNNIISLIMKLRDQIEKRLVPDNREDGYSNH